MRALTRLSMWSFRLFVAAAILMAASCDPAVDADDDADDDVNLDDDTNQDDDATPTTTSTVVTTTTIASTCTTTTGVTGSTTTSTTNPTTSTTTTSTTVTSTTTSTTGSTTTSTTGTTTSTTAISTTTTVVSTTSTTTTTIGEITCYPDADGDGRGTDNGAQVFWGECPVLWAGRAGDCVDTDPLVSPDAPEFPDDGVDQDCDDADLTLSDDNGVFVSQIGGDDANPGTMEAPVATLTRGLEIAEPAGKAVFIASGLYWGPLEPRVSLFGGYNPANWTRDPDWDHPTWIDPGLSIVNSIAISGLTISGGTFVNTPTPWIDDRATIYVHARDSHVSIRDVFIPGHYAAPEAPETQLTGIDVQAGTAVIVDSIIRSGLAYGRDIVGVRVTGVRVDGGAAVLLNNDIDANWIQIDSGSIESQGVAVTSGSAVIVGNRIYGGEPLTDDGLTSTTVAVLESPHVAIRGNTLYGGTADTGVGMSLTAALDEPVEDNEIDAGSGSAVVGIYSENDNALAGNTVTAFGGTNNAEGLWVAGGSLTASANQFRTGNVAGHSVGADLRGDGSAVLINNVFDGGGGDAGSFGVFTTIPATLVDNVVRTRASGPYPAALYALFISGEQVPIVNNVFVAYGGDGTGMAARLDSLVDLVVEHNVFNTDGVACLLGDGLPPDGRCLTSAEQVNQCVWISGHPVCANSGGNLEGDPGFVDSSIADFHIRSDSLCRDAGVDPTPWYDGNLADWDMDGDERPFGNAPDIGADEWKN